MNCVRPLTNIQGYIEAIQDGLMQPNAENLNTVHQQTLYLNHLIYDLRLLAETEARELVPSLEATAIVDVLNDAVGSFRPRADAASIQLSAEIADGLPTVRLDRLRIEQVMSNLLDNAMRHTRREVPSLSPPDLMPAESASRWQIPDPAFRPMFCPTFSTAFFAPTRPATVPPVGPALASPSPANWWKPTGGPSGLKVYPEREVVSVSTCLLPGERRQTALACLVPALLRKHKSRIP